MASNRKTAIQRREEIHDADEYVNSSQSKPNNSLKIKIDHLKTFEPLTDNQRLFYDMYRGGGYYIGMFGSPGVGKTFLAVYKALEEVLVKDNPFKQLVIVRSTVQTRDVGFLPGSLEEKQEIFEMPYKEICGTLFGRTDAWDRLKEQGYARFISTTAIRGISIDDSIIVVDECQSMTFHELSTIISRVGHRSKIIFVGDKFQNDLIKSKHDVSGLSQFIEISKTMRAFQQVTFTADDIVRSSLVRDWIIACEKAGILPT
jgi:predicted ribonuclease YlaK